MNNLHPLISIVDVFKSYQLGKRRVEVLRGTTFSIQSREFVVIKGASGTGKSTLLHLLGGLDTPDRGSIQCGEWDLTRAPNRHLVAFRNRMVGFVFQAYHLLPELDALENVCLPARMARLPRHQARRRGEELLDRVGLHDRMDHRPYELSGGEQQRVALARALMNEPNLVLADEPTGNLDSKTGGEILNLMTELHRERELTLLIATHDELLAHRAPRIIHLVDGRVTDNHAESTPDNQ